MHCRAHQLIATPRIAYPAGRNRWQLEFHIRLQPNAEKQNWAHRLYDHARAREGTDEGILLEVAGPMSTLGTFGQEELLRDVHRVVFVAIGVGFTGCIHPLFLFFHAHEAHIRPEHIRFCCRTPSAEYGDVLEPVCSAYGLRRGHELKISVSDGPAKEGEKQSRSEWNEMLTTEVSGCMLRLLRLLRYLNLMIFYVKKRWYFVGMATT